MSSKDRYAKAHQRLAKFAARRGMTDAGKRWLIAAVDPMHDVDLKVDGIPDRVMGKSICQCIKTQTTLSVSDVPRDILLYTDNIMSATDTFAMIQHESFAEGSSVPGPFFGGVWMSSVHTGYDPTDPTSPGFTQTYLTSPTKYCTERTRVISRGLETHNVTPELYKGGTVTCFKMNQSNDSMQMIFGIPSPMPEGNEEKDKNKPVENKKRNNFGDGKPSARVRQEVGKGKGLGALAYNYGTAVLVFREPPPAQLALARNLPGALSWEAAHGAYSVADQNELNNPPTYPTTTQFIETRSTNRNVDYAQNYPNVETDVDFWSTVELSGTEGGINVGLNRPIPFNSVGQYYTGLPVGTELSVFFNEWIERFPSPYDDDLIVLSTDSAAFDPVALEAYAHILKKTPTAVVAKANGLGDWFCDAVAALIDWSTDTTWASSALGVLNSSVNMKKDEKRPSSTNQGGSGAMKPIPKEVVVARPPPRALPNAPSRPKPWSKPQQQPPQKAPAPQVLAELKPVQAQPPQKKTIRILVGPDGKKYMLK